MRAHTAGKAKGRYICPIGGHVFTHGLHYSVQLTEPMRLVFVPGWDNDRYEPDPGRPGWNRPVTYHRDTPGRYEQDKLDRAGGRVFGPGCVISGGYQPPSPGGRQHGRAGVYLVPAPGADPATWFVNEPVTYKKCAACPKRVVASDKTRMDREWVPARESYWRGSGWSMRRVEISRGPHPAGTYACPYCRPATTGAAQRHEPAAVQTASTPAAPRGGTARPADAAAAEPETSGQTAAGGAQDPGHAYAAIHDAVARLAGVCDFAESLDGQGFNATDTWLGHVLAAMPVSAWTADEALAAWDMLRKYRAQLDGFGISYGGLPTPPGAGELAESRRQQAREQARRRGREWRREQYRKQQSYVRCDGEGDDVVLTFPYDAAMVAQTRDIKGRRFDWDTKTNVFPFTSLPQVVEFAGLHGIGVAPEVRALAIAAATQAQRNAARPNVYADQAGQVVISADYDPKLNDALKELNGGRPTWDRDTRVHRPPLHRDPGKVLAIAAEFGLTVAEDARAAINAERARQEHNRAEGTAFEAPPVDVPGLAEGLSLKPQQYPVVRFALAHRRVLIGDDMGWGKTLSSLAAVAADGAYPAVVVCRPSLTLNWAAEIRRFFPALAVYEASGTTPQPVPDGADVVVIGSVALAAKPQKASNGGKQFGWVQALAAAGPKALIIDEGQDTKERGANRSQACGQLAAAVIARDGLVLDLTGTAILNRPRELCQQLAILGRSGEFGGEKAFLWRYCLAETNEWGASYNGARNLIELHDRLLAWGIMIRRSDDAKLGLPPCREHVLPIPEAELDLEVMTRYRQAEADLLGFLAEQARKTAQRLGKDPHHAAVQAAVRASAAEHLVAINTLRQLAGQAKRGYVTAWIRDHIATGEKVMVAAHHRGEVDAYAATFGGLKLQGGQPVAEKEAAKAAFQQQPTAQAPVIAVAIGAGGVGHTLTAAALGIQAEQAWTPGETQQMKKRLHRIGQDRAVDYFITVAGTTIDEHLWDVVTAKQATLNAVLDGKADQGTDDGEASVAAELTWRLTQQGLRDDPGHTVTASPPGTPPGSALAASRAPSGQRPAVSGNGSASLPTRPVAAARAESPAGGSADGQARLPARQDRPALIPASEPVRSLLLITGPREGVTRDTVRAALQPRFAGNIMLVAGGAAGVDTHAAQLWRGWGGLVEEHPVPAKEWDRDPRGAGYARNARMVQRVKTASSGAVLAIDLPCAKPGCTRARPHNTHGTSHCAALAEQTGLPVDHYQAPAEPVTGNGVAQRQHAAPAAQLAAAAPQDGGDGDGTAVPTRQRSRVTQYTRGGGGQTLTVYAPRRGEMDEAAFAAFAAGESVLGLDVETSAVDDDGPRQLGPGFTVRLVQFGSEREAWVLNLADPAQRDAAAAVLADPARRFVTHTPFDALAVWSVFGIPLGQRVADTHLLSKLVNPDEHAGHDLKELSGRHLDPGLSHAEKALHARMWAAAPPGHRAGKAWQTWGWNHLPADDEAYVVYAGLDAIYVRRLLPVLLRRCAPFAHLAPMETWLGTQATGIAVRGLLLDRPYATALLAELEAERRAPEAAITAALGCPPTSPRFAEWLDGQTAAAGITGLVRTKTGQLETSADALDALLREHRSALPADAVGLVEVRLAVARTSNLIANVRGFLAATDPSGRVHPQIKTLRAKTARMSITGPALQTLKKHDPRLRRCFQADPGHVLISCDFAQVQTRVAAALSGDTALKNALASGDIHDATAELMYGPGFTGQQRDISKRATYGTLFGGGAPALAAVTGVSEDAAREVITRWKAAYPGVTAYGQRLATLPEVITPSGRRIPPDPARPYANANYVIQSTERDLLLAAVYRLVTRHKVGGLWLFMHDEVILQAPEHDAERIRGLLQQAMTSTFRGVPILAEAKILGPTWGHLNNPTTAAPESASSDASSAAGRVQLAPHADGAPAQDALFDAEDVQSRAPVSGLPAAQFAPAASDAALTGDGYQWLRALLPALQPPACDTCSQPMRLPAHAPILWTCPACHLPDSSRGDAPASPLPSAGSSPADGGQSPPAPSPGQAHAGPAAASRKHSNAQGDDGGSEPGSGPAPVRAKGDSTHADSQQPGEPQARYPAQLRNAAQYYLRHGLQPVPAWSCTPEGECCCPRGSQCPRPGKHPRAVHTGPGPSDYSWKPLACPTPEQVELRFADDGPYADANLMLAIPPGMMAIDQDNDEGGRQAAAELADTLGELPPTLAHQTPHGAHRIYRTPPGWTGRAWVGKDARNPLPRGIDLRMPGQILMAPPSRVPGRSGPTAYGPAAGVGVADLPAAYLKAWTPPQPHAPAARPSTPVPPEKADRAAAYVHAKIDGITADLAAHPPGGRNAAIYNAALKVGSVLGAARTTPGAEHAASAWSGEAAEQTLMTAAEQNGYVGAHGAALARATIRSGLRNGLRDPRPLPDFTSPPATPKPQPAREPSAGRPARGQAAARPAAPDRPRPSPDGRAPTSTRAPRTAASARSVSAVLRAGGYRASSRDRHAAHGPEGYRIQHRNGDIRIYHVAIDEDLNGAAPFPRTHQMLDRYEATLRRAGFTVTRPTPTSLAVTQPSPPAASGAPTATGRGRRMQANRAAVAANEAYRAGNLDLARQLTDQAAALDPSREGLWRRHREEIAAKRLLLSAKKAQAEGHHTQARKLTDDAQRLDPRLRQPWDRQLSKRPAGQRAPAGTRQPGAARTAPGTAPATGAQRGTSREPWNRQQPAPRGGPPNPGPAPAPSANAARPAPPSASHTARPGNRQQERTDAQAREAGASGRQSAQQTERQQAAAEISPPGAAAHTREPEPGTSPAPPPNRSSRTPAAPQPHTPSADWRDTVIETGRQAWQPRVVQPYTTFPSPPQVNGPEIGG